MDSQIVSITDLKEYDDQIKAWLPKSYVQIGANSTIAKPKICVVDDLPASPATDTIYFVKNAGPVPPTPETYSIYPTSKTFAYNVTSEQSFQITNGSGVAQTIKSVSLSGGNSDKFTARYSGTTAYCKPNGNNTSGSVYNTTLVVVATTPDGDKSFNVSISQETGSPTPTHTYHTQPSSHYFAYDELNYIEFTVKNENNIKMNATAVSVSTNKFTAMLVTGGSVKVKPVGENISGDLYTATMTITFIDDDGGTRTIDVLIHQENGHSYRVEPASELFGYDTTTPRDFKVVNESGEIQDIWDANIEGRNWDKFSNPVINMGIVSTGPNSTNMSGDYYEARLIITASTVNGDKQFEVEIEQDYMGS